MDYTIKYNKYLLKHLALEEQIASGEKKCETTKEYNNQHEKGTYT
jgi:hypothetical protein